MGGMREAPRQAREIDPEDHEALAVMGHRIERWDTLLDPSTTLDERKKNLYDDLNAEIRMLREKEEQAGTEEHADSLGFERDELVDDIRMLTELQDDPEAIADFYRDRTEYYRQVREEFLREIR